MVHVWTIGDWCELNRRRGLAWKVVDGLPVVVLDNGACVKVNAQHEIRHLPNCTGWDWTETPVTPLQYSFDRPGVAVWQDAKAAGVVDAAIEATRQLFIDDDCDETFNVRVRNGHAEWPITVKRTQRYEVVSSRADIKAEVLS